MITLTLSHQRYPIRGAFTIARGSRTHADTVKVVLQDGDWAGQGECTPYTRYGESVASVVAAIDTLRDALKAGLTRQELQTKLPAGAARNAVDCALWDLEAKKTNTPVARLMLKDEIPPFQTAYTLSLDTPDKMAKAAWDNRHRPLLKVKLGGDGDLDRMQAVCGHCGEAKVIVDANEAWREDDLWEWLDKAASLGVALVEQPLPAGRDAILSDRPHVVPICADESAHDRSGLAALEGRYDFLNIKLDKTGGLTEALALRDLAKERGFGIFIGCMMASSLGIAPATLLTPDADFVDLDAPLLLAEDHKPPLRFDGSTGYAPEPSLWG